MKRFLIILLLLFLAACSPAIDISSVTPSEYIDTGVDPESWVLIPSGEFPSGQHDHMIDLDYDYKIMITDVTNQQYSHYLNEVVSDGISIGDVTVVENENISIVYGAFGFYPGDQFDGYEHEDQIEAGNKLHYPLNTSGERIRFDGQTFSTIPEYTNHPVTMVTWFGAEAYCAYYGWRLPTEIEWEKAARGTAIVDGHGLAFPWGMEVKFNHANYYSSHDLFEKISGKLGNTTPVGLYNGSTYQDYETLDQASPYGLYDMAGNVWQWTGDDYPKQHYRYLRGGSFYSYEVDLRVWKRNSAGPTYYAPDVGFRCAQDP
ncbi:MAG: SUMF1/EgtB/PvdO family nonheme iron enzyme [Anaerolineales bacterium]|nr:SUMF1/EgtB/PvdO family nonheme iron enzyme [Anaerolineales bacterium]